MSLLLYVRGGHKPVPNLLLEFKRACWASPALNHMTSNKHAVSVMQEPHPQIVIIISHCSAAVLTEHPKPSQTYA